MIFGIIGVCKERLDCNKVEAKFFFIEYWVNFSV